MDLTTTPPEHRVTLRAPALLRTLSHRRLLLAILLLALALRLAYTLAQNPMFPYELKGGDSNWYLVNGYALIAGPDLGYVGTMPISLARLATPPLYLLFIGISQVILPPQTAIIVIRILQSLMGTATCYFAYRLAAQLGNDERIGLIAAAALAISPAFIMETAQILTETMYIFLVVGGIWAYIASIASGLKPEAKKTPETPEGVRQGNSTTLEVSGSSVAASLKLAASYRLVILAAVLFGLATLTRAVFLLFPLGVALHLLLISRRAGDRRDALKPILLLVAYGLVVSTWTVYSLARWHRLVIAGTGFAANLYLGATGWNGPNSVDASLPATQGTTEAQSEQVYSQGAASAISSDPLGYIQRRISELAGAYLQPHGTLVFPGESLKDTALNWLKNDRTLGGLSKLVSGDNFWPKLSLYIFHYIALLGGLVGIVWLARRKERRTRFWSSVFVQTHVALPMLGFILYTTLLHTVLLAIPRYLFPTEVFWWIFAALALGAVFRRHDLQPAK